MRGCPKCGQRFYGEEEFCPKDGATLQDVDQKTDDPIVGTVIDGRYHVDRKLGEGGMGVVYLATHIKIKKTCAIKVLKGDMSGEGEVVQRFVQEAEAAARIGNQHIIDITDFGQLSDGSNFFVMEFLDGRALHDDIESGEKKDADRVLRIIEQCCDGLAAAHAAGIVHRDLKPDNIFLIKRGEETDFVKILDFGIAKMASGESGKRLTKTGMIFGTPQYMSPEQAAGTAIDHRTDIYSLGIIMYEMLCGHVPFEADTFMGVLTKHLYEEPIPPRRLVPPVEVQPNLEKVLLKAMAKKPERRYQSMSEMREDVRALIDGQTPRIVYDSMRDTAATTEPPPPPSAVVGGTRRMAAVAADAPPRAKSRLPLFLGLGAIPVIAGIVAAVIFLGGGSKSDPGAQPLPPPAPVANPAPVAAPTTNPAPVAGPVAPTLSAGIKITCSPDGAEIFLNGALMGKAPLTLPRPEKDPAQYTVKLDGYKDLPIVLTAVSPAELSFELEKRAAARRDPGKDEKKGPALMKVAPVEPAKKGKGRDVDIADPWAN